MTTNRWLTACLLILPILTACTPPTEPVSVTRPATLTVTAVPPSISLIPLPTHTAVSPTVVVTETAVRPIKPGGESTATPLPRQPPNPTPPAPPAISPEELARRVEQGLAWTAVPSVEGFPLRQLTGFKYGFRYVGYGYCEFGPYRWLTDEQLLLFPIVAYTSWFEDPTFGKVTQPLIFNTANGTAWLPDTPRTDVCDLPVWSAARQQIIEASQGEVRLRDLTGNVVETYSGSMPLFISPSGQRLLAGQNWIDLTTGEVVTLAGWQRVRFPRPAWSSDETEIFECCFSYVNVATNEQWTRADFPGFWVGGVGVGPGYYGSESRWLANDTRVMIQPEAVSFLSEEAEPVLPMINPKSNTYVNITEMLELPETVVDCGPFISPSGAQLWLTCAEYSDDVYNQYADPSYLIALPSLEALPLSGNLMFRGWSADGRFLTYNNVTDLQSSGGQTWLMRSTGEQQPVAELPAHSAYWHPIEPVVALNYAATQQLLFVQAETGQSRWLDFPHDVSDIAWQPNGAGITILATNDTIYWLADPFAANSTPVPITPPMPEVNAMRWSPNGRYLAFISENDFYMIKIATE